MRIGVLSLQGSVEEHEDMISRAGHTPVLVKYPEELKDIDGLIIPGGESTAITRLLRIMGMDKAVKARIESGLPVWGTCAGMILLAKRVQGGEVSGIASMDITVNRNIYGTQIDSFKHKADIKEINTERAVELVFIRAPAVTERGEGVKVIHELEGKITAARENNILVSSFHPELTEDLSFINYFTGMIKESQTA